MSGTSKAEVLFHDKHPRRSRIHGVREHDVNKHRNRPCHKQEQKTQMTQNQRHRSREKRDNHAKIRKQEGIP